MMDIQVKPESFSPDAGHTARQQAGFFNDVNVPFSR